MNFNPAELMENIKNMQSKMQDFQGKLKDITAEGSSGGGLVKVTINGEMEVTKIILDPIAVNPQDIEMLQDLILAALNSAHSNIKDSIKGGMGDAAGMDLPFDLNGFK